MRILFTGATSFAGRRLWDRLVTAGHDVLAVSRRPIEHRPAVQVDLASAGLSRELPQGDFDVLVHFAAFVPLDERASRWSDCHRDNVAATARLVEWASGRVGRVLLGSSVAVYGAEKLYVPTDEAHPVRPDTGYALSKYAQEQLLHAMCRLDEIPLVVARLGHVYGPGIHPSRAIVRLLENIREGQPIRLVNSTTAGLHLIHVEDVARICEVLLEEGEGVYNLAGARHVSLAEYVDTGMKVIGRDVPVTTADDPEAPVTNFYCGRRLSERHGVATEVSLAEGIESMIAAFDPRREGE